MRRNWLAAGVLMTLAASVMAADIDFSDFDDDLMQSMDDAIKELDSNVGGQDAKASLANAAVLRDGFAWAEKYFAAKPEAPLGAGYAREGQEHLAAVVQADRGGKLRRRVERRACGGQDLQGLPRSLQATRNEIGSRAPAMRVAGLRRAVMAALSFGVAAQNLLDFDDWMQRIEDGSLDLQRAHRRARPESSERRRARNRRAVRTDGKVFRKAWQRGRRGALVARRP